MSYHSAVQENIEYASSSASSWENGGHAGNAGHAEDSGKYTSTITNIMAKHCAAIQSECDEVIPSLVAFSKKKLKDLIHKHDTEIFSFLVHPDKLPHLLGSAESIFRKYGQEVPTIRGVPTNQILRELRVDASLDAVVQTMEHQLASQQASGTLATLLKQLRWLFQEYKNTGEEVLRLETTLFQKMEMLDKIHQRLPSIMNLTETKSLPSLIDAFSVYAKEAFQGAHFEENYTQLVEEYKKWNVCRQIISSQHAMRDSPDPPCAICLLDTVSYAIVPCGHTFCSSCSKKQNTTCYICRGVIRERLKLFFM